MGKTKKPSALNAAKLRIKELEERLEEQKNENSTLKSNIELSRLANADLCKALDLERKIAREFEEDTNEFEGMRKFMLQKLKHKRKEYVNSLFSSVVNAINVEHTCKAARLRQDIEELSFQRAKITVNLEEVENRRI